MQDPIDCIRQNFGECITRSCREKKCSLCLEGMNAALLAIINGTKYQEKKNFQEKLCDRIIFSKERGLILAAVELKGGKSVNISEARNQIQNGLRVAKEILGNCSVSDWHPVLVYRGRMNTYETKLLQNKPVRFQGTPKNVIKRNCGSNLNDILLKDE